MPLYIEINETQTANYGLSARAVKRVTRGCFDAIGREWQKKFLPRHFSTEAMARYGYRERSKKYMRRKMLGKKGRTPLVYSGMLKRALTGFTQRQTAYPSRVTIHLVGPSYLNINYKPGRPNLGREIMAVSADEKNALAEHAHGVMFRLLEIEAKAAAKTKRHKPK